MNRAGVVVAHPGRQHSHQVAIALSQAELLTAYWTGIPCLPRHARWIPNLLWSRAVRYSNIDLSDESVVWNPIAPTAIKLAAAVGPIPFVRRTELLAYRIFDRWCARKIAASNARVFVGYETAALESFRAARGPGMVTVLDAASIHHRAQDRLHGHMESKTLHQSVCDRKDQELALADIILTVSDVARDTYLEAGIQPERVKVIPLGADLSLFTDRHSSRALSPFRFLFVGAQIYRKGLDLLLDAFTSVRQRYPSAELVIIGGGGDASGLLDSQHRPGVMLAGPMTQVALADEYRNADCLVLPSRNDSYGMVVAEALASGLPTIVSDMVGAKDWIQEGKNGWIIPTANVEALIERMRWCVDNVAHVRKLREIASESAKPLDWASYRARIVEFYKPLCS